MSPPCRRSRETNLSPACPPGRRIDRAANGTIRDHASIGRTEQKALPTLLRRDRCDKPNGLRPGRLAPFGRDRRKLIKGAGAGIWALGAGATFGTTKALALDTVTMPFENGERPLVKYPQKRPMIGLTSRPPQLETPFSVFDEGAITPNDAFFVRYHLAGIPLNIDPDTFIVEIKGKVDKPVKLSLQELKQLDAVELVAVNQCSGNSRGFVTPRVAGGQLGNGAMGNARWKGVALNVVLDKSGIQPGARQVTFNGLVEPISDKTPDFVKALDIDHARDGEVMLAYAMNGQDLPVLNGFPLRLLVPGSYATYC